MERATVESILKENGYSTKNELAEGDSKYTIWYNKEGIEEVYLGNYYIESIYQPTAFPYKDKISKKVILLHYLEIKKF